MVFLNPSCLQPIMELTEGVQFMDILVQTSIMKRSSSNPASVPNCSLLGRSTLYDNCFSSCWFPPGWCCKNIYIFYGDEMANVTLHCVLKQINQLKFFICWCDDVNALIAPECDRCILSKSSCLAAENNLTWSRSWGKPEIKRATKSFVKVGYTYLLSMNKPGNQTQRQTSALGKYLDPKCH